MREGIAKHGGYEINTEGDAFQVAFTSVHQVGAGARASFMRALRLVKDSCMRIALRCAEAL
jgi:class 3 adenylate cyclase